MSLDRILNAQQHQVLNLIAAGSTATAAANAAGVHRNTVGKWLRIPAFRQALDDAHAAQALYWREQAELLAASALDALKSLLQDPGTRDSVRLKAALAVLDRASASLPAPAEPDTASVLEALCGVPRAEDLHDDAPSEIEPEVPETPESQPGPQAVPGPRTFVRSEAKTGRNGLCPCGSGIKYKKCCLGKTLHAVA
ncbi:MAG: SEC-C metal-binding domain-containing protein [Bryobacteraceae bacterium]